MMRRKDENGFTLVELVISMGMFSIVMLAIMFSDGRNKKLRTFQK